MKKALTTFVAILFLFAAISMLFDTINNLKRIENADTTVEQLFESDKIEDQFVKGEIVSSTKCFYMTFIENSDHPKRRSLLRSISHLYGNKNYFYVVFLKGEEKGIIIRSNKKWADNFDSETNQPLTNMILTGQVKKTSTEVRNAFTKSSDSLETDQPIIRDYYVDTLAQRDNLYSILAILFLIGTFISFPLALVISTRVNKLEEKLNIDKPIFTLLFISGGLILTVVCLFCCIYFISFL
ncbi:MAG: hypothetical protein E7254_00900 [Lachnospiraceae bacterium]|nr:hypothetical protein [Lachnospiraceae bacterium]